MPCPWPGSAWPALAPPDQVAPPAEVMPQSRRTRIVASSVVGILVGLLIAQGRITHDEVIAYFCIVASVLLAGSAEARVLSLLRQPSQPLWSRVDLLGTILLPAGLLLGGIGYFGWLRADRRVADAPPRLKLIAAAAAPLTAGILVLACDVGFRLTVGNLSGGTVPLPARILYLGGLANVWLLTLSFVPVPPLLGSLLLERLLPTRAWPRYLRLRPHLALIAGGIVLADLMLGLGVINVVQNWLATIWSSVAGV